MNKSQIIFWLICLLLYSCADTEKLYIRALNDAKTRELQDVSFYLTAIDIHTMVPAETKVINGETYLLMIAWKADAKYYFNDSVSGSYNTGNYPIYVTIRSDFSAWIDDHYRELMNDTLRLKQLLGLPPTSVKKVFVEFWVRPQDLIRPCPDAEINDLNCELDFPNTASCDHILWFTAFKNNSFTDPSIYNRYPFTGFGYTYDWNRKNRTHRGLSEFVIGANTNVIVGEIKTTEEFLNFRFPLVGPVY